MIEAVLTGAIRSGTSVLFACQGELLAQRAGIVNLGTEGSMLAGAMTAFAVTAQTGNPFVGVFAGGLAGALMALIHAFLAITRRANQLAAGLAVMILAQGLTAFLGRDYVSVQIKGLGSVDIPFLSDLPIVGKMLFQHDILTYLAIALVPLLWLYFHRTRWGLVHRATGERDEVVYAAGYSPVFVRYAAVVAGGFLAGIGGAQLSVAFTLNWVENMTQGRGLVAVALVIFGSWSSGGVMIGAYLFGGALALQLTLQAQGASVSPFLLSMTPYVMTLVVLLIVGRWRRDAMPEGLRAVFEGAGDWARSLPQKVRE